MAILTSQTLLQNPNTIFVHEDSLRGWEHHPNVTVFRYRKNAIGIPVCHCFERGVEDKNNLFQDKLIDIYLPKIREALKSIPHNREVWIQPELGKIFYDMETVCPMIYEYLKTELDLITLIDPTI